MPEKDKKDKRAELGHNYLNTAFTGRISNALSGTKDFPILPEDRGVAATLGSKEFKSPSC